ncbi:MAG: redoxin family protein [Pirellulales bacterium]
MIVASQLIISLGFCCAQVPARAEGIGPLLGRRVIDASGERHYLGGERAQRAIVFVFFSAECPICQQFVPELNRLNQHAREQGLDFFCVFCDATASRSEVRAFQGDFSLSGPLLLDTTGEIAGCLQPKRVPEAIVVDSSGKVAYRGRINNLYSSPGQKRPAATQHDLRDAIDAVAQGESIENPRTQAVGCLLETGENAATRKEITFTRHIAPILYANCTECHRPGEVAPFSLITYDDAAKRADWIAEITSEGLMPPWHAEEGYGYFRAERRLSPVEKQLIRDWADADSPLGDDAEMPTLPDYPTGWRLGEPDLVFEASHSVTVPAEGPDQFHHFVIPVGDVEDAVAVAVEFQPGNPRAVHHAIVFVDDSGMARRLDEATPEPGFTTDTGTVIPLAGTMTIWAPGVTPPVLPKGVGQRLPKGSDIVVQLHLHPTGREETDRSRVGIHLSKEPVDRFVSDIPFIFGPLVIDIPPGEKNHEVSAELKVPIDVTLTAVMPHMHLLGRRLKVWAKLPSGDEVPLVWVKNWDFYWQNQYVYREPVRIPKGSTVHVVGSFDNSADNPRNPSDPPQRVLLGEESTDEMCLAIFQAVVDQASDSDRLRNAIFSSAFQQVFNSDLSPELQEYIAGQLRQLSSRQASPEAQQAK